MVQKMLLTGIVCATLFIMTCTKNPNSASNDPVIADTYESDNTQSTAKRIYPDSGSQVRTLKKGDTDYVAFSATSGQSYKIFTSGNTDTRIKIFSPNSSSPIIEGDDSPGSINALIVFNCTSSGTYYICVCGNDESVVGSYNLSVVSSVGPDSFEPDSLPKFATSITPSTYQKRSLTEGDVDWISCYIAANDTVLLTATKTCGLYMTLYGRDTVTQLASASTGDSVAQIRYRISTSGNYFLKVTPQSAIANCSYRLTMQTSSSGTLVAADPYENDNTQSSAKVISGNSVTQLRSLMVGDTDWVLLPVIGGRQYTMSFSSASSILATMYAKDGTILLGPSSSLFLNSSATDTVYVQINATVSTAFNYSLNLSVMLQPTIPDGFEIDNLKSQAKAKYVPSDSFIQDRTLTYINSLPDTDWVAFPAMAAKQYTFRASSPSSSTLYLYLYDNISSSYLTYTSSSSSAITYTPTVSDTMYLMICRPNSSVALAYTLSVGGQFINDNFEPDSSRSTAKTLTSASQSHILLPGDTDWVVYTATPGDSIVMVTTGSTDTKLDLFSSSGSTPMLENDDGGSDGLNAMISWKSALGGQFYVRVTGKTPSINGSYTLQALSVLSGTLMAPDSFENDNSKERARIILDTALYAEYHSLTLNDTDWVAFPAIAGGQYTVTASSSSSSLTLYAYTSKDSLFGSRSSTTSASIIYTAPKNDTLYYRVTSLTSIQRYSISMNRVAPPSPDQYEIDDTKAAARIILDSTVNAQAHSLTLNDTDWVAFPAMAGGQYTVTVSSSSSALSLYAYTSKDSLFGSRISTTSASINFTSPKNDTLYYRVTSLTPMQRYTLSMSRVLPPSPDQYENDNTKAKARIILDTMVSAEAHSLPLNDTDWVAFPALAGGQYTVTVSSSSSYLTLYAYTAKDSLFGAQSSTTSGSIIFTTLKNDTLYYRITSAYSLPRYTLSMSRVAPPSADQYENDNTKAKARIILDTMVSAEAHSLPLNDTDWVAFPAVAGGQYTVTVSSSSYLTVYAYTSKDSLFGAQSSTTSASIIRTSVTNDTLYYRITSANSLPRYTLSMSRVAPLNADLYENDNIRSLAKPIVLDSLQSHTMAMRDTDWVKIELTAGNTYRVTTTASFYHYVYLYLGTSTSASNYNYGTSNTFSIAPTDTQTLYVQVRQYSISSSYTGSYTIKVSKL